MQKCQTNMFVLRTQAHEGCLSHIIITMIHANSIIYWPNTIITIQEHETLFNNRHVSSILYVTVHPIWHLSLGQCNLLQRIVQQSSSAVNYFYIEDKDTITEQKHIIHNLSSLLWCHIPLCVVDCCCVLSTVVVLLLWLSSFTHSQKWLICVLLSFTQVRRVGHHQMPPSTMARVVCSEWPRIESQRLLAQRWTSSRERGRPKTTWRRTVTKGWA